MNITKNTAVTLQFKVTDTTGKLLDQSQEPIAYLHGGYGNTFPKIEEALEGQGVGFATTVELAPADAFGEYNEALLQTIPKTQFPPGVKVGGQLEGRAEDGNTIVFTVTKIKGPVVHLDGLYWQPGWVAMERAAWRRTVENEIAKDAWIIDGNFGSSLELRLSRAQAAVYLDYSRAVCLAGVLRRVGLLLNRGDEFGLQSGQRLSAALPIGDEELPLLVRRGRILAGGRRRGGSEAYLCEFAFNLLQRRGGLLGSRPALLGRQQGR